jgi:hypothetical protein
MGKFEVRGVKELAGRLRRLGVAVDKIADDGVADGGQVHADLVSAPRL